MGIQHLENDRSRSEGPLASGVTMVARENSKENGE